MTSSPPANARGPVSFTGTEWRDAYLICHPQRPPDPGLIASLTAARLRLVTSWAHSPSPDRLPALVMNCSVIIQPPPEPIASAAFDLVGCDGVLPVPPQIAAIATQHGIPIIELSLAGQEFMLQAAASTRTIFPRPPWPLYAFMATRIHEDFQLIRSAIRSAIESELKIPCIYFEDRRIITAPSGVRARTKEMIRGASFFVADLTYSDSCPDHDSPNTAHEVGMAMAYGIPIVVCARQPRRNIYFLAGDLDTIFWKDEKELFDQLCAWLHPRRELLGLNTLNKIEETSGFMQPEFRFDPALQYKGSSMKKIQGGS